MTKPTWTERAKTTLQLLGYAVWLVVQTIRLFRLLHE